MPDRLILQLKSQYQWHGVEVESLRNHISQLFALNELTEPTLGTSHVSVGRRVSAGFNQTKKQEIS
jgi:hypothetical protein